MTFITVFHLYQDDWLVGCVECNGPLRQALEVYPAPSHHLTTPQDDGRIIMIGCVKWNLFLVGKISASRSELLDQHLGGSDRV